MTGDTQCMSDTAAYGAGHICLAGACTPGNCHNTSGDCMNGQVCNTTNHTCQSCGSGTAGDTTCKGDTTYGTSTICLAGGCTQGDCHNTSVDCQPGQICGVGSAHVCGPCGSGSTGDGQCTSDTTRYGTGNICFQGACTPGDCHATSADCTGPTNTGRICGVTTANTCGACTSDSQCKADAAYGSATICNTAAGASQGRCVTSTCANNNAACTANTGDFCCSSACVAGNCCNDNDCANNPTFGVGYACSNNNCTQCNPVSGSRFLVDPVNGNDTTANGSGMSGASAAPGCAFKTLTRALQVIPSTPPAGTKIVIVGQAGGPAVGLAAGDTLPITLPANTMLTTQTGPVTITLLTTAAGNPAGFRLLNAGSAINGDPAAPLTLEGNDVSGIAVQISATMANYASSISNVTIQNTNGDGIRVTAGALTIGAGVVVSSSNQDGLRVSGGSATINNPSGSQTLFTGSGQYGIEVSGLGSVNITGTPGAPVPSMNGTVLATFNTTAGIRVAQTGVALALNNVNGVVAWGNGSRDVWVLGGSRFKLRNSVLGAGPEAIRLSSSVATVAGNDLSQIDLGTPSDFGHNYIQVPNGALGVHSGAGICVVLSGGLGATFDVLAAGNFMTTAGNPGTQLNCANAGGTVSAAANCTGRVSFGNATPATLPTTTVTRNLSMCN